VAVPTYNAQPFQAQNPSYIIPQDSSPLWQNVANVGFTVLENANVKQATEQGAVEQSAAGPGQLLKREGFLGIQKPSDVAFNNAAQRTFLLEKNNELKNTVRGLSEKNLNNPEGFQSAVQDYRASFFTGIPEHLSPVFKAEFDGTTGDALSAIKGQRRELDRRQYSATWAETFKGKSDELRVLTERDPNDPRVQQLTAEMGGLLASASQPTNEGFYIDPERVVQLSQGMAVNKAIGMAVHEYNSIDGFDKKRELINSVTTGKAYTDITSEDVRDKISRELRERFNVDQQQFTEARAALTHEVSRAGQALESGLGTNLNIGGLPQRMAKLGFNSEQVAETMLNLRQSQRVNDEMTINRNLSLPALRDRVDQQRASLVNPSGSDEQRITNAKLYDANARLYAQMTSAIASDPYKALEMYRPSIYAKHNLTTEQGVLEARQSIQQQFGLTTPPVAPPQLIQSVKQTIERAQNADEAISMVAQIQQRYPTLAPAILEEAGLDSKLRLAARSYFAGRQQEGALIWNASRNEANNKKGLIGFKEDLVRTSFDSAFGSGFFKANPAERADYYKAFESLYVEGMARGVSNPQDYAANVLKNTGAFVEVGNTKLIGPVGTDAAKLQATFESIGAAPELLGLHLGDPNNKVLTPTLGDIREGFRNKEFTIARDGESFVIVNNQGQRLMRETPSGFQPLHIDKFGNVDKPTIDANVRKSELFEQEPMIAPSLTRQFQQSDPRTRQTLTRTGEVPTGEYVGALVKQATDRNLPADPFALKMSMSSMQRQELSAVSNFIAKGQITAPVAKYLSQYDEFKALGGPNKDRIIEAWNNSPEQARRQVNRISGREQSPLQTLLQFSLTVQAQLRLPDTQDIQMGAP
jgi:hypothetical protein